MQHDSSSEWPEAAMEGDTGIAAQRHMVAGRRRAMNIKAHFPVR
jgi:hypothetical protein